MSRRPFHRVAALLCLVAQAVLALAPGGTVISLRMPCECGEDAAFPCCAACVPPPTEVVVACSCCQEGDATRDAGSRRAPSDAGIPESQEAGDMACCLPGCICCISVQVPHLPALAASAAVPVDSLLLWGLGGGAVSASAGTSGGASLPFVAGQTRAWTGGVLKEMAAVPLRHVRLQV